MGGGKWEVGEGRWEKRVGEGGRSGGLIAELFVGEENASRKGRSVRRDSL